jgi:hypothetical protein
VGHEAAAAQEPVFLPAALGLVALFYLIDRLFKALGVAGHGQYAAEHAYKEQRDNDYIHHHADAAAQPGGYFLPDIHRFLRHIFQNCYTALYHLRLIIANI